MQIKVTDITTQLSEWLKWKILMILNAGKAVDKWLLLHGWWECKMSTATQKLTDPFKTKNGLIYEPALSLWGIYSREMTFLHKNSYICVHDSFIYNSPKPETAEILLSG